MTDTILVPFELPDHKALSSVLVDDLATLDIVVLGHFAVPEQTPVEAAREQFEAESQTTLDEIAERFREVGATARTRLVFGKQRAETIDRVMIEEDCAAELNPAPTDGISRILVPVPAVDTFDRLPAFVDLLCEETTQEITLFHVAEGEESRDAAETIVVETSERMREAGFAADAVDTLVVEGESHDTEILAVAADYDAVVMYAAESELSDHIFGSLPDRIGDETGDPVIVVRRDYDPEMAG